MARRKSQARRRGPHPAGYQASMMGKVRQRLGKGVLDWIVSGAAVGNTGAPITANIPTSWGPSPAAPNTNVISPGNSMAFQCALIQPTPMSSTPSIGRVRIDEVRGRIFIRAAAQAYGGVGGYHDVAIGLFVANLNNTTTIWTARNVIVPADAAEDDYFLLEGQSAFLQLNATNAGGICPDLPEVSFEFRVPLSIVIGGGQALHLVVANGSRSAGSIEPVPYFRTLTGPVA